MYKNVTVADVENGTRQGSFSACFNVNITTRDQFEYWMSCLEDKSKTQFTVGWTWNKSINSNDYVYQKVFKCTHNVKRGKLGRLKHTKCPSELKVRVSAQSPVEVDSYPCAITILWHHNHPIDAADVLRRHRVSEEVDRKLIELYRNGHSPSTALKCIKLDLEENVEDGDMLEHILANRALCPDVYHCHYVFQKLFKKEYGNANDNLRLGEFADTMNRELGDRCVAVEMYELKQYVAICTPLMKRVHQLVEESGELVFVDSSGGFDRDGFRVFLFVTHSKTGGTQYYTP